ncbi:HAD hydrolase-like protein [Mameliella alba]|nr:HAD hydrolase-like protein [Mameliella alba]MBY6168796.1 HAD hydrolase-like protein [Mameliella alba]MBY6173983.1 HAD hydrolase-like protein [Mameliella alba]
MALVLTANDRLASHLSPDLVAQDRLVLCDLDGCLVSEGRAYADSAAFLESCGERLWLVSNNSTHCAADLSADLADLGLRVPADRILLAGEQTLAHLARLHPGARLALFASAAMEAEAERLGFDLTTDGADLVLLCRDTRLSLDRLNAAASLVQGGAVFWVSNTDTAHPGHGGQPIAETGALLAALRAMLTDLHFESIGKPHPHLAALALSRTGVSAAEAVFVGDNPDTDGAIARAIGTRFVQLHRMGSPE